MIDAIHKYEGYIKSFALLNRSPQVVTLWRQNWMHLLLKDFIFEAISQKLHRDEKNNYGSNTDNYAQGQTTKSYLVFNIRKCFK